MAFSDPFGSETDSLFGDIKSPQRGPASLDSARGPSMVDFANEPSLFVDEDFDQAGRTPSNLGRSRSSSFNEPGLDVLENAVSGPLKVNRAQTPRSTHSDYDSVAQLSTGKIVCDSEEEDASESVFEGFDDDIPADVPDDSPAPTTENDESTVSESYEDKSDGSFGAVVSEHEWLALHQPNHTSFSVTLPESSLLAPRSHYQPFDAGAPEASERTAVTSLMEQLEACSDFDDRDFLELHLNDFAVYSKIKAYGVEMRALNDFETKFHGNRFVFDGLLSAPGTGKTFFVRGVPIQALPIGNYSALDEHTVRDDIWILSPFNSGRELYYKLCRPAREYKRFHEPFLWVADLAKHFVDFLKNKWDEGYRVSIHDFRVEFKRWLLQIHGNDAVFQDWQSKYPRDDFRTAIIANLPFLHKEAVGVLGEKLAYVHTLWKEAWAFTQYKPPIPTKLLDRPDPPTIVTQYIKECFKTLPFADWLKAIDLSSETTDLRNHTIRKRHLELSHAVDTTVAELATTVESRIKSIRPGDTLSTKRDEDGHWKREEAHGFTDVDRWFVLVQEVHIEQHGRRSFDVIWYYRPVDTLCGGMSYPWSNELFLSDHCNCGEQVKVYEDEVLGVHDVDFHGTATTTKELFCRQTYLNDERKWVTLENRHLRCEHQHAEAEVKGAQYKTGETVLAHLHRKTTISEPCEVISSYQHEGRQARTYNLRRFLRRRSVETASIAPLNELVYSDNIVTVNERLIKDQCFVRQFRTTEVIPTPYDRGGTGNFFFITHEQVMDRTGKKKTVPLKAFKKFKQGHDPSEEIPKLRGLDLFCGGGNLGRGLEDGGGIHMKWANDYVSKAIHTYMANVDDPHEVYPFLGSIDIMQQLAIEGKFSDSVPKPGDVDFISGGSPCPGFSRLTNDKTTGQQRKNQSLVAAFASMVDLYRPKYGLLENVPGIVQKKENKDQDVFSQLICAIVGLGYQTSFYLMDANSCGAPQKRARVFLVFAAPGCELPPKPKESHSQPPWASASKLGLLPNDQPMADRVIPDATPFKYVTTSEATTDLPRIYDAKPDICIPFPDHRVTIGQTTKIRREGTYIPVHPYGMNFAKAWFGENLKGNPGSAVMTASEREFYPPEKPPKANGKIPISRVARNSQAYGRCYANAFFSTVTTRLSANDAKDGRCFHWSENRVTSLMEARRAQGFCDEDVLLGNTNDQYKIVGNSVAREIALALGAAFREAWAATLEKRKKRRAPVLVNGEATKRHSKTITIDSTDGDTDSGDLQLLPRRKSSSNLVPSKSREFPALQRKPTTTNVESLLNGNGKRRASTYKDTRESKAPRRSSTSLLLTQESSRSRNAETTKTTMTVTQVDEVQPHRRWQSGRDGDAIVIDD